LDAAPPLRRYVVDVERTANVTAKSFRGGKNFPRLTLSKPFATEFDSQVNGETTRREGGHMVTV
jgi:hypothetical protein